MERDLIEVREAKLKEFITGVFEAPKFSYVDLGKWSGRIILRDDYTKVETFWKGMSRFDEWLSMLLDADIIQMKVDFMTEVSSAWEVKFEISFQYD